MIPLDGVVPVSTKPSRLARSSWNNILRRAFFTNYVALPLATATNHYVRIGQECGLLIFLVVGVDHGGHEKHLAISSAFNQPHLVARTVRFARRLADESTPSAGANATMGGLSLPRLGLQIMRLIDGV